MTQSRGVDGLLWRVGLEDGIPGPRRTFTIGQLQASVINPTGELPEPQNVFQAMETLNQRDGFELTEVDQQIATVQAFQLTGHFLIDRDGIIRWLQIEAIEGSGDLGKFPSDEEIVNAARRL
jgi:hypothetical protein